MDTNRISENVEFQSYFKVDKYYVDDKDELKAKLSFCADKKRTPESEIVSTEVTIPDGKKYIDPSASDFASSNDEFKFTNYFLQMAVSGFIAQLEKNQLIREEREKLEAKLKQGATSTLKNDINEHKQFVETYQHPVVVLNHDDSRKEFTNIRVGTDGTAVPVYSPNVYIFKSPVPIYVGLDKEEQNGHETLIVGNDVDLNDVEVNSELHEHFDRCTAWSPILAKLEENDYNSYKGQFISQAINTQLDSNLKRAQEPYRLTYFDKASGQERSVVDVDRSEHEEEIALILTKGDFENIEDYDHDYAEFSVTQDCVKAENSLNDVEGIEYHPESGWSVKEGHSQDEVRESLLEKHNAKERLETLREVYSPKQQNPSPSLS